MNMLMKHNPHRTLHNSSTTTLEALYLSTTSYSFIQPVLNCIKEFYYMVRPHHKDNMEQMI